MHILHVTPHLPPDQAANALLPWQLGTWAREAGDSVSYVAHPPRAGGHAQVAGPVTWVPRRSRTIADRVFRTGALTGAWRIRNALAPAFARMLSDLVRGVPPELDLTPYHPGRFGDRAYV